MIDKWINMCGLCFDIAGASILFKYGLIGDIASAILSIPEKELKAEDDVPSLKKDVLKSNAGFALLIVGFVLQLTAQIISIFSL